MSKCVGYGNKTGKCSNAAVRGSERQYCKNCAGKHFEVEVAHLFEIQGYQIRPNLRLSGTQNDFLAKITYGIVTIQILVECKWKGSRIDSINSGDIRKLEGSWKLINGDNTYGSVEKAFLVTNGSFSPEAIETATKLKIQTFTYTDLINHLINFEPYLRELIEDYHRSNLEGHFIDIQSKNGESLMVEIEEQLDNWDEAAIVVLGEYGCGKTSLCIRLANDMALKALNTPSDRVPILIRLRDYTKAVDMDQLITNLLINKWNIPNGNMSTFIELAKLGKIVLIFDGFDEIAYFGEIGHLFGMKTAGCSGKPATSCVTPD
jgi:hypothetical protein